VCVHVRVLTVLKESILMAPQLLCEGVPVCFTAMCVF